jgi:hypothetical protein
MRDSNPRNILPIAFAHPAWGKAVLKQRSKFKDQIVLPYPPFAS